MKNFFLLLLCGFGAYAVYFATIDETQMPKLRDGDIVLQTTWTDQSIAIALATLSPYIHMGIVKNTGKGPVVIHAADKVKETPLSDWIKGGIWKRVSVYRHKDFPAEKAAYVLAAAKRYYDMPYDHAFSLENNAIYCSELVYLAFTEGGAPLHAVQKIGELYINNPFSRALIEERWQNFPACQKEGMTFDKCYDAIMQSDIVTPKSLADDPYLERIFTNYP